LDTGPAVTGISCITVIIVTALNTPIAATIDEASRADTDSCLLEATDKPEVFAALTGVTTAVIRFALSARALLHNRRADQRAGSSQEPSHHLAAAETGAEAPGHLVEPSSIHRPNPPCSSLALI
jgi:hypothetical protein